MVDSHCHIAGPEFAGDLDDVIARAREAGVSQALVILAAEDEPELAQAAAVAARWDGVRFAVGVHPQAAGLFADDPDGAARCAAEAIAAQPGVRAVGEIGLDYHYERAPREVQQAVFRAQIRLARDLGRPIVIHTREATDDTFRILAEERASTVGGVLHCFTGDREMAQQGIDAGLHVSLSGIVTFPRAYELREVARMLPLERLLIETDSPFLAPVPYRGSRNEPARVTRVAEVVAEVRGMTAPEVGEAALRNYVALFNP